MKQMKKRKDSINLEEGITPGLFGQKYSSRDYRLEDSWGKNQFNSSFPASLVAYMGSKDIDPILICTDKNNEISHGFISSKKLLGIDPLSDNAYYDYEANYFPYEQYYTASKKEKIDLVMIDRASGSPVSGLEVKLTTLPDNTTKDLEDSDYGSEIVVRSPTILFLACSICTCFESKEKRSRLFRNRCRLIRYRRRHSRRLTFRCRLIRYGRHRRARFFYRRHPLGSRFRSFLNNNLACPAYGKTVIKH